jgi:dolichyl-diphosphooligosaccharide--protein glycosyltransferase
MSADTAEDGPTAASVLETWRRWYHLPALALIALYMFWVRVQPYDNFVTDNGVNFSGNDPYYHFRATMYTVRNWPGTLSMDPWTQFPYGTSVGQFGTLFDVITATVALIVGLGDPSAKQVGSVAVLMPAVLGTLCLIPVYYMCRQLTEDRLSAIFGSFVFGILPTSIWLSRSTAGTFDHHVAETLLMSLTMLSMLVAVSVVQQRKPVYEQVLDQDWGGLKEPFKWSALVGVAYALYVQVWPPGVVIVGILGIFFLIALSAETVRERSPEHLAFAGIVSMSVGALLILPFVQTFDLDTTTLSLLQVVLPLTVAIGCLFMAWLARQWNASEASPWGYPLTIGMVLLVVLGIVIVALPDVWGLLRSNLERIFLLGQSDTILTISEAQAMDVNNLGREFYETYGYGFTFLTAFFAALWLLVRSYIRDKRWAEYLLVVVWTGFLTLMSMTQIRFHAYLVVPVAVLNGWLFSTILQVVDFPSFDHPREAGTLLSLGLLMFLYPIADERHGLSASIGDSLDFLDGTFGLGFEAWVVMLSVFLAGMAAIGVFLLIEEDILDPEEFSQLQSYHVLVILAIAMVVVVPIASPAAAYTAPGIAQNSNPGSALLWEENNEWLQDNTPTPGTYGGADNSDELQYYGTYKKTDDHEYPDGAYGVMSWWDYGHWITVQGERIPVANPFQQGPKVASEFLLSQNETRAELLLEALPAVDGQDKLEQKSNEELRQIIESERTPDEANEQTRYVMIDNQMAGGKFGAITQWTKTGRETPYFGPTETTINNQSVTVNGPTENYDRTMLSRLYFGDARGLEHYRLVHENSRRSGIVSVAQRQTGSQGQWRTVIQNREIGSVIRQFQRSGIPVRTLADINRLPNFATFGGRGARAVKTFERVEGATLEGQTAANATVISSVELSTNTGRTFNYTQRAVADSDGSFAMTVPYPTVEDLGPADGYTNSSVLATGDYTVQSIANRSVETGSATVSEAAVVDGESVSVELSPPQPETGNDSESTGNTSAISPPGEFGGDRTQKRTAGAIESAVGQAGQGNDGRREGLSPRAITPQLGTPSISRVSAP